MADFSTAMWILGVAAFVVLAVFVFRLGWRNRNDWLLRCPETGSIALVNVAQQPQCGASGPQSEVRQCGLWPNRKNCAHGCLVRLKETSAGYKPSLEALRPFESNEQAQK